MRGERSLTIEITARSVTIEITSGRWKRIAIEYGDEITGWKIASK